MNQKFENLDFTTLLQPLEELKDCCFCPRNCHVDRFSETLGYCKSDAAFNISSICNHRGEEPPISGSNGICNIFFTNCNLQCVYCQNYQISKNIKRDFHEKFTLKEVLTQIIRILDTGINIVGFVSPSHFIPQMKVIVNSLKAIGRNPIIVYNTNGYDIVSSIKELEEVVDVYLPDFKYCDKNISKEYSDAEDYSEFALNAIKEMYSQKGSELVLDEHGYARKGIIIRHLVLPEQIENSINVLRTIAKEISPDIHISLMSQYFPTQNVSTHPKLCRTLRKSEYEKVVSEMENLGMFNGWVQDMSSYENYRPDFSKNKNPFE
ncbi:MAG: radical SAM protein [Bacteroidales bacterium]|nr:radical SAM protein [Bacteroidales bacterium]